MQLSDFNRLLRPIKNKIFLLLGRAVLKAINNDGKTQTVQVVALAGETITNIERFQEYGFETYPLTGAEPFIVFQNGNRDNGVVLCIHDREYRPTDLVAGEVASYTDEDQNAEGHRYHFKRGQIIDEKCKSKVVTPTEDHTITTKIANLIATASRTVTTKIFTVTGGNVILGGHGTVKALLNADAAVTYDSHTHAQTGGANTLVPNQLMTTAKQTVNTEAS